MTTEVRVPQLPESVADATLVTWHKKAGDTVSRDENLADLETDKVVLEVPAPVTGVLSALKKDAGATVGSGELLAIIEETAAATQTKTPPRKVTAEPAKPAPVRREAAAGKLSPSVKRLVEENKLAAKEIAGSGRDGRITKVDVAEHLDAAHDAPRTAAARIDQRVPMSRLRARIAERLVQAQTSQALLTTFN